jgi:hypothetical protein
MKALFVCLFIHQSSIFSHQINTNCQLSTEYSYFFFSHGKPKPTIVTNPLCALATGIFAEDETKAIAYEQMTEETLLQDSHVAWVDRPA